MASPRKIPTPERHHKSGMVLMEVTVALGVAVFLTLLVMKGSLLAISGNQWTVMQTLSDAYLTRETALSNRIPMSDLTASPSLWPDRLTDNPPCAIQTVNLGILPSGKAVQAQLTRFRTNETPATSTDVSIVVWKLYSVLTFNARDQPYAKTRSTLRTQ